MDSPQKNASACMVIEKFFVEDCFKVQIFGSEDEYVVPVDAELEVTILKEEHFSYRIYEDIDVSTQPTLMEHCRRVSYLSLSSQGSLTHSRPCSASAASSIQTSYSSMEAPISRPHISKCEFR